MSKSRGESLFHLFENDWRKAESIGRTLLGEIWIHGYGHTSVYHVHMAIIVTTSILGYWFYALYLNTNNNLITQQINLSFYHMVHFALGALIYNPFHQTSPLASSIFIAAVFGIFVLSSAQVAITTATVWSCMGDMPRHLRQCYEQTDSNRPWVGCYRTPATISVCPMATETQNIVFCVLQLAQYIVWLVFTSSLMFHIQNYRLGGQKNALSLLKTTGAFHSENLEAGDNGSADDNSSKPVTTQPSASGLPIRPSEGSAITPRSGASTTAGLPSFGLLRKKRNGESGTEGLLSSYSNNNLEEGGQSYS